MLATYVTLGFRHIADPRALDHALFLLVLAAIFRPGDWRAVLGIVTAFTVGHSITLGLASSGLFVAPAALVEFLIPVTIVVTGVANIVADPARRGSTWRRALAAGAFGLVHGAGFAGYLRAMLMDDIAVPLFGFNLGVEAGQVVILVVAFAALALLDAVLARVWRRGPAAVLRLRAAAVSAVVTVIAGVWAFERAPW